MLSLPLLDIFGNQSRLVCVRGKMNTTITSAPILQKDTVIVITSVNNTTVDVGFRNRVYRIPTGTSSVLIEAASMQLGPSSATMTPSPWHPDSEHLRVLKIKCRRMIIKTRQTPAPGSEPTPTTVWISWRGGAHPTLELRCETAMRGLEYGRSSIDRITVSPRLT